METATGSGPIRIALLGTDAATLAIARAVVNNARFEVAGVCEPDSGREPAIVEALAAELGRVRQFDSWEALLDGRQVDAVLVARGLDEDRRAEQLRKLIQTGVAVVASHPVVDSMLVYYELDMIRRDTRSVIVPYLPERHHPAVQMLARMAAEGAASPLGTIEQVVLQRRVAQADYGSVVSQFARDVDVIRAIAGDLTRLGAMAGAAGSDSYAGLGVQMSGPASVVARWSVDPVHAEPGAQLSVLGASGRAVVELRANGQPWTSELTSAHVTEKKSYEQWNPAEAVLAQLEAGLAGGTPRPDWVDACRAVELAETIDRSLVKARTIDLYYEDYTEEGTFKGLMTSIGCGLLILALGLMGLVAIGDHIGLPYARYWPHLLLAGLAVFLLLQLLTLVFRQDDSHRQADAGAPGEPPPPPR